MEDQAFYGTLFYLFVFLLVTFVSVTICVLSAYDRCEEERLSDYPAQRRQHHHESGDIIQA